MPAGDDQAMPGRNWIPIPDDHAVLACGDDTLGGQGAKRASGHASIQP